MLIVFIIFVVVLVLSDGAVVFKTTLSECEQVIKCPQSLRDGDILVTSTYGYVSTSLMRSKPQLLPTPYRTTLTPDDKFLGYNDYKYESFNLVAGSTLAFSMWGYDYFDVYLVEGSDNLDKFIRDDGFTYLRYFYDDEVSLNYTAEHDAEYIVIITCTSYFSYGVTIRDQKYIVDHLFYDMEDPTLKISDCSTTYCSYTVDPDDFPGPCVIAAMPCGTGEKDDITIEYDEAHSALYYAALVITILGGVGFVATIALCVFCVVCKNKGSDGQTYQTVPAATTATVVVPAAYQQPQPVVVTPSYAPTQPVYTATTPAYATVDPAAPAPAYVQYGATAPPPAY